MTELVEGDLKENEELIVADATQVDTQNQINIQRGQGGPGRGF
jgi:hypothetical protein